MKKNKSLKIFSVYIIIFVLITVVLIKIPYLDLVSWMINKYSDYEKHKYYESFPTDPATVFLKNTLDEITIVDQYYSKEYCEWVLYVQSDTTKKTEEILRKVPELIEYGRNNYKDFSQIIIYCQLDYLTDHFACRLPYEFMFLIHNVNGNNYDINLTIDASTIDRQNIIQEIFENGKFPQITTVDSNTELNITILSNFPNLEKYRFGNDKFLDK